MKDKNNKANDGSFFVKHFTKKQNNKNNSEEENRRILYVRRRFLQKNKRYP